MTADRGGFKRSLRVILTDRAASLYSGAPDPDFSAYPIAGFAVIQIDDYSTSTGTIKITFLRFDRSCGEAAAGGAQ
jgi:hypothetical protein